ncbi:MAG TPA: AAA family ATPase, partial [Candidatus Udaeobacter sp.]|nr:AAA family ATPase [Candidatus Udaeobacter sp.]
ATDGAFKSHPGMLEVSKRVMREREISSEGKHELFGYLLLIVENGVPFFLIGPAGTGKSYIAKQVADYLGIDYGETSMAAGSSRSDLLGRHTINREKPFIPSEHSQQYSGGGLHLFDEIDRANPSTMVPLHNALASDELYNSINGERYAKSDHYAPGAAGNTFGLGANRQYTSAERLDAATLDRFRMGRIYLPIDETMEERLSDERFNEALSR